MMLLGFSSSSGGEAASTAALLKSTSRLDPSGNAAKPTYFVFYRAHKIPRNKEQKIFLATTTFQFFYGIFFSLAITNVASIFNKQPKMRMPDLRLKLNCQARGLHVSHYSWHQYCFFSWLFIFHLFAVEQRMRKGKGKSQEKS